MKGAEAVDPSRAGQFPPRTRPRASDSRFNTSLPRSIGVPLGASPRTPGLRIEGEMARGRVSGSGRVRGRFRYQDAIKRTPQDTESRAGKEAARSLPLAMVRAATVCSLCRRLCRNPAIPAHVGLCRRASFGNR